jgi:RNA polymerase sigma-70 factor, ECF subfamily
MEDKENLDSFLFNELKQGNQRAFDKIFNDQYQNLCRFAVLLIHDEDEAHSLVQQVFVKLWEKRHSLDHICHLIPYLTVMVRNHCLNYLRDEKKLERLSVFPETIGCETSEEELYDAHFLEEKLIIAIAALPERCRMAFELSRFENMSNKDIAIKMDISVKGVEALIGRSLKTLRISLSDFLPSSNKTIVNHPILLMLFKCTK